MRAILFLLVLTSLTARGQNDIYAQLQKLSREKLDSIKTTTKEKEHYYNIVYFDIILAARDTTGLAGRLQRNDYTKMYLFQFFNSLDSNYHIYEVYYNGRDTVYYSNDDSSHYKLSFEDEIAIITKAANSFGAYEPQKPEMYYVSSHPRRSRRQIAEGKKAFEKNIRGYYGVYSYIDKKSNKIKVLFEVPPKPNKRIRVKTKVRPYVKF